MEVDGNLKCSPFKMKYNTKLVDKLQYDLRRDSKCQHTAKWLDIAEKCSIGVIWYTNETCEKGRLIDRVLVRHDVRKETRSIC